MKYYLTGDLENDPVGLGGIQDVFAHIGRDPGGSRDPKTHPGWMSV